MTSVDHLARCLSNRRLSDHLLDLLDGYADDALDRACLKESVKRLRECTCPRIIPGGAAPLGAAGRRVDRGPGSPPVPDPGRHPNGKGAA